MTESLDRADEPDQSIESRVRRTVTQIDQRAATVRDRELETALGKLEEVDERDRAVIERLATRLTEQLTEPPKRSLEAAIARDDAETITVARELFGD
jgi:glutamyl-tRNA reductase